jgi:hypothetical protein
MKATNEQQQQERLKQSHGPRVAWYVAIQRAASLRAGVDAQDFDQAVERMIASNADRSGKPAGR